MALYKFTYLLKARRSIIMPHRVDTKYLPLHFKPPQQHLYNGLAHPAHYSTFAWEWTRLPAGESMLAQE